MVTQAESHATRACVSYAKGERILSPPSPPTYVAANRAHFAEGHKEWAAIGRADPLIFFAKMRSSAAVMSPS